MPPEYFFPLLGLVFGLGFAAMGTVRWYLRERLRAGQGRGALDEAAGGRIEALEGRVAELEERLDFTERVLARERASDQLPRGGV